MCTRSNEEWIIIIIKNGFHDFNEETHIKLLKEGWRELKEPKNLLYQTVLLLPLMVITSLIALTIMSVLISTSSDVVLSGTVTDSTAMDFLTNGLMSLLIFLGIGTIVFIVHELIHLLFIPNSFKSDSVYINLICFGEGVHTTDELPKKRVCLMYIAPFIFLSVVLNVILGIMGLYTIPVMIFIFLNSIGCSEDILELIFILLHVPKNAKIVNNGVHTYFRVDPKFHSHVN